MAITYIVGNPGSGKTYFAVNKLYEYFVEPTLKNKKILGFEIKRKIKTFDYLYCYTNINGLKFDISNKLLKFDFDVFYLYLSELYNLYSNSANDDEINIKANELKLFKSMFIIDEIHNVFKNKDDKILIWWLTYHRHIHQEIILITQDLSLVSNEYKRVAEFFYKALDSGKRISKNSFRYAQFSSYKMYGKDLVFRFSLKANQEVFNLYQSGKSSSNKSFFTKIFIFAFISFFLLILFFYIFLNYFNTNSNDIPKINSDENNLTFNFDNNSSFPLFKTSNYLNDFSDNVKDFNSTFVYKVNCIQLECNIVDKDDNSFFSIPRDYFDEILNFYNPVFIHKTKIFKGYSYFLVFKIEVFDNLKKGVKKNDKSNEKTTSFNSFKF